MAVYKIHTTSRDHFIEVLSKLVAVGFVYTTHRFKTIEEIEQIWEMVWYHWPVIIVGWVREDGCKMILRGDRLDTICYIQPSTEITVDNFLKNVFPFTW